MTNNEAKICINDILSELHDEDSVCYVTIEDREALDMAVKALKQEPCEDCISRKEVLEFIGKQIDHSLWAFEKLVNGIKALPPVTPKQKWIPVSERLPIGVSINVTKEDLDRIFERWESEE